MKNLEGSSSLTLAEPESEPGQHSTIRNSVGGGQTGSKPASSGQNLEEPMFQSDGGGGRFQLGTFSVDSLQFPVASSVVLALCSRCLSSSLRCGVLFRVRPSVRLWHRASVPCHTGTFSMWDWGDVKVHKVHCFLL